MAGPISRRSNASKSVRGSRIALAIIFGILVGCIFAVLYPHGLFSNDSYSDSPFQNRRLSKLYLQARNLRLEMSGGFGEMASKPSQSSSFSNNNGSNNGDGGNFDCSICLDLAQDPIVTLCGHLFCWPCIYQWLNYHSHSNECPLCKAFIQEEQLIPLYGRGTSSSDSRSKSLHGDNIPNRPTGQRPEPGPPPDRNQLLQHGSGFIGGFGPAITASFGNITLSFGGFIPSIFNVQMHTLNYGGFHAFQREQRHEVSPLLIVGLLFLCALLWE